MKYVKAASVILLLASLITQSGASATNRFPPVPEWQPEFAITNEEVLERMVYYFDDRADMVIFSHGTAVILPDGLDDSDANDFALRTLTEIFNSHPDMKPLDMEDGNILISYNLPAYNVVIDEFANTHIETIRARHLDALATDEAIITSEGVNKFNEFGMKALYGRTFMFMDAQDQLIVRIYRRKSLEN